MNPHPFHSETRPYIEPDHFAHGHDGAIPVISAIGKGPKGDSITAERSGADLIVKDDTGAELARFTIGDIEVSIVPQNVANISGGQSSYFDVIVSNGAETKSSRVVVPCGERGAQIWVSKYPEQLRDDEAFTVHEYEANPAWGGEGITGKARLGDVVMCGVYDVGSEPVATKVAFGYIVGFTSEQYLTCATQTLLDMSSAVVDYRFINNKPQINDVAVGEQEPSELLYEIDALKLAPLSEPKTANDSDFQWPYIDVKASSSGWSYSINDVTDRIDQGDHIACYLGNSYWLVPIFIKGSRSSASGLPEERLFDIRPIPTDGFVAGYKPVFWSVSGMAWTKSGTQAIVNPDYIEATMYQASHYIECRLDPGFWAASHLDPDPTYTDFRMSGFAIIKQTR